MHRLHQHPEVFNVEKEGQKICSFEKDIQLNEEHLSQTLGVVF